MGLALAWVWTCGGLFTLARLPGLLVLALIVLWPVAYWRHPKSSTGITLGGFLLMLAIVFGFLQPRKNRDWDVPYLRLPQVTIDDRL